MKKNTFRQTNLEQLDIGISVLNGESIKLLFFFLMRREVDIFSCIFKDLLNALKYNVEHT